MRRRAWILHMRGQAVSTTQQSLNDDILTIGCFLVAILMAIGFLLLAARILWSWAL